MCEKNISQSTFLFSAFDWSRKTIVSLNLRGRLEFTPSVNTVYGTLLMRMSDFCLLLYLNKHFPNNYLKLKGMKPQNYLTLFHTLSVILIFLG